MQNNIYKQQRKYENLNKAIYVGVGYYGIPELEKRRRKKRSPVNKTLTA